MSACPRSPPPQKITFAEMRESGVSGLLIYCADYRCSHCITVPDDADRWPDELRISDVEDKFVCTACGKRGADIRPDFGAQRQPGKWHAYRAVKPRLSIRRTRWHPA